jgi:hypothetical protein
MGPKSLDPPNPSRIYILIKLEVMKEPSGPTWIGLDTFEDSFE